MKILSNNHGLPAQQNPADFTNENKRHFSLQSRQFEHYATTNIQSHGFI